MKTFFILLIALISFTTPGYCQTEPAAGKWKTWFISSVKKYSLPAPPPYMQELDEVFQAQKNITAADREKIMYWNAGAPNYLWQQMMNKLWTVDTGKYGVLANLLMGTAIYDAMVAAWDTKYSFNRPRPFAVSKNITTFTIKPESPSYPCEYSVAAGVAVSVISKFYPHLSDSVNKMAQQLMQSRIAAGLAFPTDTRAGFELGKQVAKDEIEFTKAFVTEAIWDGKLPQEKGKWTGKYAMHPLAGNNKTVVLTNGSQFRPAPPPDFSKEMEELKNYKQTFRSQANVFYWASQDYWSEALTKKIFEQNLHLNPPRAARIYAAAAVAAYDGFIACWDAKYAYWGMRPNQFDTTYKSLIPAPPFPGYPSGHAMMSGMFSELYGYFFPMDAELFRKKAKGAAESRFQAGIHFRSDNEVGLELGKKVASVLITKLKSEGADNNLLAKSKRE